MPVAGEAEYPEDIRLRYRFLDLRRERLHANIMLRSKVITSIRRRMVDQGFTEFQTPILTASSPEGARDYLVPSRVHPGKFYALPQAPQMFKQLLMVAGLRPLFPDRAVLPRRGCPRRPVAGRILPARFRDELRHAGRRFRGDRARAARRVRGIRRLAGQGPQRLRPAVPAHSLPGIDAEVRQRQARSAQPDRHRRRLRAFRGLGLRSVRDDRRGRRRRPRDPGARHGREEPQVLRRHERLGAGRRFCGSRLCDAQGRRVRRPDRQEPRRRRG